METNYWLFINGNDDGKQQSEMNSDKQKRLPGGEENLIAQLLIINGLFVQRELNQVCQQKGINSNQFSVLNQIVLRGPLSQKVLCERLLFEKSNISKIVKTLLGKALIDVATAPEDRRLTLLIETQEGVELWRDCLKEVSQLSTELLSILTKEEVPFALQLLKKLEYEFRAKSDK